MRTFTVFAQALNMRYAVLGFYSSAKCVHYRDKWYICRIGLVIRNKLPETWHYSVPQMRTNVKAACT